MEKPKIRFGVIGATSYVAQKAVIPAIRRGRYSTLCALSSRSNSLGTTFTLEPGERFQSAAELLEDPDIDAIYLPLPNDLHKDTIIRCLSANKHVLCEKPILLEPKDFDDIRQAATAANKIVAEAFMTAYHTRIRELISMVKSHEWGVPYSISTTFTGTLDPPLGYRFDPHRGGGAVWDVGIYGLYPIVEILGLDPDKLEVQATMSGTPGVDLTTSIFLQYPNDVSAFCRLSFRSGESQRLEIFTNSSVLSVDRACTPTELDTDIVINSSSGRQSTISVVGSNPYQDMVDEVAHSFIGHCEPSWSLDRSQEMCGILQRVLNTIPR